MKAQRTIRVLLVEDSEADAFLLQRSLSLLDGLNHFETDWKETLEAAKTSLLESDYDVILPDLSLPDSQGVGTVQALCTIKQSVPLIVLSGLDDDIAAVAAIKAEAQAYLVKGQNSPKQLETAILHAIERHAIQHNFREALLNSGDAVLIFDQHGQIIFRNDAALTTLQPCDEKAVSHSTESSQGKSTELKLKSGRVVESSSVPLIWNRKPAVFCSLRDITARKRAAALQKQFQERIIQSQRLESLGTLAGGIAHEFNNLLTGVLGNADLLVEGFVEPEEIGAVANEIRNSARKLSSLTRLLLGFARKGQFRSATMDLNQKIRELETLLQPVLRKTTNLKFELAAQIAIIEADPDQVSQMLLNLALNGQDAMPQGGTLCFYTENDEQDRLILRVQDEGVGIPEENRGRIFDPFFTTKPMTEGTGMGLAMVWGVANQNGWGLEFETEVGKGTTFFLSFPPHEISKEQDAILPQALVYDQDPVICDILTRYLGQLGYGVSLRHDMSELLELAEPNSSKKLVICEYRESEQNNPRFAQELRLNFPEAVVILTSPAPPSLLTSRPDGFLPKPFDFKLLACVLEQAVAFKGLDYQPSIEIPNPTM